MATIREVVEAFSRRPGVDAVVVVGRDGLPIDSHAKNGVDPENVAALLPSVINGMTQLGEAARRGEFGTGVLEFGAGLAVVSVLNAEAVLGVDDEPHIGLLLRPHLEHVGYRVSLARTLGQARHVLADAGAPVDALLL